MEYRMRLTISDQFWSGVSTAKGMFFEVTQKPDFLHTDDLRDFIHSVFDFIGGQVCKEAMLLTKYYGLAIKVMDMPKNFATLCWTPEPSFNFFTMNVDKLTSSVEEILEEGKAKGLENKNAQSVVNKLLKTGDRYYSYKNEAHFKDHLIKKIKECNASLTGVDSKINALDLTLVKGDERFQTIAEKCIAFGCLAIPIAWAGSIGVFAPAFQALAYVGGSLGQYRVFSLLAQIPVPTALVSALTVENVIVGAFVTGLAIKTWMCVKAYFAAQVDQKDSIRNNGIANLFLAILGTGDLFRGDVRWFAPLATGANLWRSVSQPKMADALALKKIPV
jgi:hypothetical protein